jgi:type IX secretion system PorP/SprF family membrane protein
MMGRLNICFLAAWMCLLAQPVKGQSNGMISQYMFNRFLINPAYAGINGSLTINSLYKDQWTNVPGAPSTSIFSVHTPANERVGLGLTLLSDRIGGLNQKGVYGAYAFRIISRNHTLSFGLQAGLTSYKYRHLFTRDECDPVFSGENASLVQPNFGTGIYYENNSWYIGLSVPQLVRLHREDISRTLQNSRYILQGGCSYELTDALALNPSAMVCFEKYAKPVVNLNANLLIEKLVWVGAIYRNLDNLGFLGKIQFNRQLQVGYGYDASLGGLVELSTGSHEVMIQYSFDYVEKNIKSPRFF